MEPSRKTIYAYLAEADPEQPLFLTDWGTRLTCGQVKAKVDTLGTQLQRLFPSADAPVVLRIPRTPEGAVMELSLLAAGIQVMLADPHVTARDYFADSAYVHTYGYLTDENGTWTLLRRTGEAEAITGMPGSFRPFEDAMAPAVLITTSGSTGDKKTVVLSQYNLVNNLVDAQAFGDYIPGDLALGILPLFHIFGQVLLFGSMILGYGILFPETVSPESALGCVERFGVTRINGVPSLYLAMAEKAGQYDLSTLRVGFIGGSPCMQKEIRYIEEKLGMKLLNAYGMSECVSISISCAADEQSRRIGGVGHIYPMSRVKLRRPDGGEAAPGEIGEITVNGASRMLGYYRDAEATRAVIDSEGFLHTGDLGYLDPDGILHITGRIKEIIIRNGVNLSARAVEAAMLEITGVRQAAVVGIPDEKQGEVPAALYTGEIPKSALLAALADRLPKNMLPALLLPTERIPLTATGKPDKQTIKQQLMAFLCRA